MCYELVWNREVLDEAASKDEAEALRKEYEAAVRGPVSIRHRANAIERRSENEWN